MTDQISVLMGASRKMSLAAAQTEEAGSTIVQLTHEEIGALRTGLRLLMAARGVKAGEGGA